MTNLDMLYLAVLDNPEEDTPRLMFADALEETGHPDMVARADFTRRHVAGDFGGAARVISTERFKRWFGDPDQLGAFMIVRGFLAVDWNPIDLHRLPDRVERGSLVSVNVAQRHPLGSVSSGVWRWRRGWSWAGPAESWEIPGRVFDLLRHDGHPRSEWAGYKTERAARTALSRACCEHVRLTHLDPDWLPYGPSQTAVKQFESFARRFAE